MVSATGQALFNAPARSDRVAGGSGQGHGRDRAIALLRSGLFVVGQVVLLASLYVLYDLGRHEAVGREPEALHHARRVWDLERLFDLPNESSLQALALRSTHLPEFANRFYIAVHFPAAILFLLWVLIFHRPAWRRVRTVIVASTGAALLIHIAYPLAPPRFLPRMLPDVDLVDTGAVFGPSPYGPHDTVANQYAAMPSLHIGWAILEAWGVITILRTRARWLAIIHPVITTLVVVVTANHYWIDGIIGGALVVTAVQLTRPEVQARLRLWAITARLPVRGQPLDPVVAVSAVDSSPAAAGLLPSARRDRDRDRGEASAARRKVTAADAPAAAEREVPAD
ncbi:phosphatase PAP2 family protein [Frankia sp. AgB32]|uniref:phosphatase PAP2 family protein n=1 Tax=Frankia sp. AgB32 TaxID=631119 RepID=UPI00200F9978|nr:phosphatase PAP2 family protein [Frankia sp. AgB32]MCK9893213.1 phosphatase PAP2 family protein [Frankia sp. AgB32]